MARGDDILVALQRGREDHQFFSRTFLNRSLHDGQLDFVENAVATINVLPTGNRWGKTSVLPHIHFHGCVYKIGGEPRYLDPVTGQIRQEDFLKLKYHTIHTAGDFETASLVWDEAHKMIDESQMLQAFIKDRPRSKPPHIDFIHRARWKFRTLGHDASGIDGNSFYVISIDEAGWIDDLETKMQNVIRVRVADVRGRIYIVGTMKPGVGKDFFKFGVRASAYTGVASKLDHRTEVEDDEGKMAETLDSSIRTYLREYVGREVARGQTFSDSARADLAKLGINPDELADAIGVAA